MTDHCCLVAKLYLTLCDPMDCGPPGSAVHEMLQARILKWAAISFSQMEREREKERERERERCYFLVVGLERPRPLLSPSGPRIHRRVSITGRSSQHLCLT